MAQGDERAKPWQLRLASEEDEAVTRLAKRRTVSKNDIVRYALRLLMRLETETEAGGRLLVERPGARKEPVELWLIW